MAQPCSVCEHPDRAQVEIALANGVAQRVLALRYGLDRSQLSRHFARHVPDAHKVRLRTRAARSDEELAALRDTESKSLLDNLTWQRVRLYANADAAAAIGDLAGERAALAEASRVTERTAKLLGELDQHITVNHQINLVADPIWHMLRTELVRALRPYGDAHPAAIAALQRVEQMAAPRVLEHAA